MKSCSSFNGFLKKPGEIKKNEKEVLIRLVFVALWAFLCIDCHVVKEWSERNLESSHQSINLNFFDGLTDSLTSQTKALWAFSSHPHPTLTEFHFLTPSIMVKNVIYFALKLRD